MRQLNNIPTENSRLRLLTPCLVVPPMAVQSVVLPANFCATPRDSLSERLFVCCKRSIDRCSAEQVFEHKELTIESFFWSYESIGLCIHKRSGFCKLPHLVSLLRRFFVDVAICCCLLKSPSFSTVMFVSVLDKRVGYVTTTVNPISNLLSFILSYKEMRRLTRMRKRCFP